MPTAITRASRAMKSKLTENVPSVPEFPENAWRDATIGAVIEKIASKFGGRVLSRFRSAERLVKDEGFMSTGTLSGDEYQSATEKSIPTLWIMSVESSEGSFCGGGH